MTGDQDDFAPSACSPHYDDEDIPLGTFIPPEPPAVPLGSNFRAFLPQDSQADSGSSCGVAPISGSSCGVAPISGSSCGVAPILSSSRSEGVAPKQPVFIYGTLASTSTPSPPAPSRPRPKAISVTRKPTAPRNLFVDSSSAAEVTVGDGDFDSDLVLPLVVVDMPRQSVPQLVQLFERNASRQDRAAQPLRLDTADDEDEFSGPTSAVCYDCSPHADENDLSAFDERMRAADERIAGYFAAVQASYL